MQVSHECSKILPLDKIEPSGISYLAKQLVCQLLDVSPRTLDRHRDDLIELVVPRFQWQFYSTGYDRDSIECLWQYTQLVRLKRREIAREEIKKHMERFWK